ncbi:MAG: hypothetical protein QW416_05985 [Candidatus Nitrosocaldaceae archaeon]
MEEDEIRSILSQLGMFLIKKSKEIDADHTDEWMSAWEINSNGISIVLAVLLTEHKSSIEILKNKLNEFAAATKIELKLFDIERS